MIKVVIAEDESIICELIINLINWEQLQLELVGKARNGIEAYELITALKPDIVITDIRMPGMTGLELIEKVKQDSSSPMFIIISGHKEFEYARNAIKFGVDDYLLKPIKKDELNSSLAKLIKKRNELLHNLEFQKDIQEQLTRSVLTIRKERLYQYFYNIDLSDEARTAILRHGQEFHFSAEYFQTMAVRVDFLDATLSDDTLHVTALDNFCNKVQTEILDFAVESEYSIKDTLASFVINISLKMALNGSVRKKIIELIKQFNYKYDCLLFSVGIGQPVDLIQKIPASTAAAHLAINHRIDHDDFGLVDYQDIQNELRPTGPLLSEDDKTEFARHIAALNPQYIRNWLDNAYHQHYQRNNPANYLLYDFYEQLIEYARQTFVSSGLIRKIDELASDHQIRYRIASTRNPDMMKRYVREYLDTLVQACLQSKENQEIKPIRVAKQYISEHYSQQITLEDIAQVLNLNPVYLGALFRNKTGTSFTNYLISVRIEKAKEFLRTTSESIAAISEQVGYSDAKHFSRLFTKSVGIKPVEYRRLYS